MDADRSRTEHELINDPSNQQKERKEIKEEAMPEELEGKGKAVESKERDLEDVGIEPESVEKDKLCLQSLCTLASGRLQYLF